MDEFARWLAAQAHQLNLNAVNVTQASPEHLRQFSRVVLEELAARGLIEGEPEIGCWATPRNAGN